MKRATKKIRHSSVLALILLSSSQISLCQKQTTQSKNSQVSPVKSLHPVVVDTIEEKLVAIALKGPVVNTTYHQGKINEYQLQAARTAWLNLLTFQINYNDQSFQKQNPQNSYYVYPIFYLGVTIPMGTLFSRIPVKQAKEQVAISQDNQLQLARNIRAQVISKYRQYKTQGELISLQIQVVDDEQAAYLQAEKNFKEGTVSIEVQNAAQKKYNDELASKLKLQLQQDIYKLELEAMIGTELESVIN
jgi:outer membrane protein TolC